eukprot:gene32572-39384_t
METGSLVWVQSAADAPWSKAKVSSIEQKEGKNGAKSASITLSLQDHKGASTNKSITVVANPVEDSTSEYDVVKLRNYIDELESDHVNDLILLNHLHEPAILWTLQNRFKKDMIYTNTGPILIALNPFKHLTVYSQEKVETYYKAGEQGPEYASMMPPHVFKVADSAYRNMLQSYTSNPHGKNKSDQAILVSGESGAGKTETTKFIMRYLADVTKDYTHHNASSKPNTQAHKGIEHLVLQSNPILESFGNARTLRNDNSSRFGKFIEINFAPALDNSQKLRISGATIRTYLLERVRLVYQSEGERNYHCFYEFLSGALSSDLDSRGLSSTLTDYKYLSCSTCSRRFDGVEDSDQFGVYSQAMTDLDFTPAEQEFVKDILAAILHLGNVKFTPKSAADKSAGGTGEESCLAQDNVHASFICSLLQVDLSYLTKSLCEKIILTKDEVIIKSLQVSEAEYSRDALAKTLYSALFAWLVMRVNRSIEQKGGGGAGGIVTKPGYGNNSVAKKGAFIGVLDIFGFENFAHNSFEQLCINYTNETLQQHFNAFVFEHEQQLYTTEGIQWEFVSFPDNKDTLDLLENKLKGIFSICDDQSRFNWATSITLCNKLYEICASHKQFFAGAYEKARFLFVVKHYAAQVTYDSSGFIEKNNDLVSEDMIGLLRSSQSKLLVGLVDLLKVGDDGGNHPPTPGTKSKDKCQTVGSEFRRQLKDLMTNVSLTTPHYVRCIKPNAQNKAAIYDHTLVCMQLKCCGVIEAVRVSRAGFPNRFTCGDFVERYRGVYTYYLYAQANIHTPTLQPSPAHTNAKSSSSKRRVLTSSDAREQAMELCMYLSNLVIQHTAYKPMGAGGKGDGDVMVKAGMQIGISLVFMRRNCFDILEQMRMYVYKLSAVCMQKYYRRHTLCRCRRAKKRLLELKIEARSLKKVVEERDLLANQVKEWERKFAEMQKMQQMMLEKERENMLAMLAQQQQQQMQQQQQQQQQAATISVVTPSVADVADAATSPLPSPMPPAPAPPAPKNEEPAPAVVPASAVAVDQPVAQPTNAAVNGSANANGAAHVSAVLPEDYLRMQQELEETRRLLAEMQMQKASGGAAGRRRSVDKGSSHKNGSTGSARRASSSGVANGLAHTNGETVVEEVVKKEAESSIKATAVVEEVPVVNEDVHEESEQDEENGDDEVDEGTEDDVDVEEEDVYEDGVELDLGDVYGNPDDPTEGTKDAQLVLSSSHTPAAAHINGVLMNGQGGMAGGMGRRSIVEEVTVQGGQQGGLRILRRSVSEQIVWPAHSAYKNTQFDMKDLFQFKASMGKGGGMDIQSNPATSLVVSSSSA